MDCLKIYIQIEPKHVNLINVPIDYIDKEGKKLSLSRDKSDWSGCQYHFNGKNILSALLYLLKHQQLHTDTCPNKHITITYSPNDKLQSCDCPPCKYCQKLHEMFNKKSTDLIKYICCKQRGQTHDWPPEMCVAGNCDNGCGVGYVLLCLRKHPKMHTFANAMVRYDQNEAVGKVGKHIIYGIKEKHCTYNQFIGHFTVEFLKYIKHHVTFTWQYLQKIQQGNVLNKNNLITHWDFINNPIVQYYQRLNNQWGTKQKFAYLIGIEKKRPQESVIKTSLSYFIKDPKHDFAAAHHVIRKYCIQKQSDWHSNHNSELKQVYFRSDRGEFLCVGFIYGRCMDWLFLLLYCTGFEFKAWKKIAQRG